MARYRGALCRLCRREGVKLNLKGKKCDTAKCTLERRNFAPGQHGKSKSKLSEYGTQLREKQKMRRIYGIGERQFASYFGEASRRKGVTGDALLQILETRLDTVVYRLGFATCIREGRQIVRHGHIRVNNKKVNIPSYRVKGGDSVAVKETGTSRKFVTANMEITAGRPLPEWVSLDKEQFKGNILRLPERKDINIPVNENMIVELYSK
jgi:small subunit ribosomal protein S4